MRHLVVVAGLAAFTTALLADIATIEQIIAKVNGEIVTNIDLDHGRAPDSGNQGPGIVVVPIGVNEVALS